MLRAIIFAPILFLLVLFALSNPEVVQLKMWPTDVEIGIPLSITVLLAMAVSFLLGALLVWFAAIGARLRARRAEHAVRMLETQVAELKQRVAFNSGATTGIPTTSTGVMLPPPS